MDEKDQLKKEAFNAYLKGPLPQKVVPAVNMGQFHHAPGSSVITIQDDEGKAVSMVWLQ